LTKIFLVNFDWGYFLLVLMTLVDVGEKIVLTDIAWKITLVDVNKKKSPTNIDKKIS